MTKRNANKTKTKSKPNQRSNQPKNTRAQVRQTPSIGAQLGDSLQKAGVSLFKRLTGMGDYQLQDNLPALKQNSLFTDSKNQPPSFSKDGKGVFVFEHSEYLGDITSSAVVGAFKSEDFIINPGDATTFPWLSGIAKNFEYYQVEGMIFRFQSTSGDSVGSTNTAMGTVIGHVANDVSDPLINNKASMLQYEGAVGAKISENFLVGIECDPNLSVLPRLHVGSPEPGTDARFYHKGKFVIASQGVQNANMVLGELYVHYRIKLFVTKQANASEQASYVVMTGGAFSAPFSHVVSKKNGDIVEVLTNPNPMGITYEGLIIGQAYLWTFMVSGTFAGVSFPARTITGATLLNYFPTNSNYSAKDTVCCTLTIAMIATSNQVSIVFDTSITNTTYTPTTTTCILSSIDSRSGQSGQ